MTLVCRTAFVLGFAALWFPSLTSQTITVNKENRTIAITATDTVTLLADTAGVHVGFIAYGPDSDTAYANGSRLSNAIIKVLTASGIPNDAIESQNQNVSPVPDFEFEKLTPDEKLQRKFQVTQSWIVRVPANDEAKALDIAVKAGANDSGGIDWSLKDENVAEVEAASKALRLAQVQATAMAKGLNARLGALLYASNSVQAEPIRPRMKAMGIAGGGGGQQVEPLAINPRQIEKSATVYAVFAIE